MAQQTMPAPQDELARTTAHPRPLRRRMLPIVGVLAISGAGFAMTLAGDASAATARGETFELSSDEFLQPGANQGPGGGRIAYETEGRPVIIDNGGTIPIDDDLEMTLTVSPYPPTTFDLEVDLFLTTVAGEPVSDASVVALWDMMVMEHGPFRTPFTNMGNGHHVASLDFFMFGPWQLTFEVEPTADGRSETVNLSIYLWPE